MLIIPDTNFLVYMTKYKLWHQLEKKYPLYSLLVLPQVVYELKVLTKKAKGKDKEAALLAFDLVKDKKIKAKKGHADAAILQIADWLKKTKKKNFIIATMDKILKQKLKKAGVKVLIIRQKRYLTSKI